ncbi:MAG: bifunctional diaminohydroxyphosphoribosylaminopyrimidine deaminase/5-amino-6-(5-phosphoribosylamino)uracil reductase RibD [Proteiniphilum sp.]|jgi:diaminohydroxyphosphoribosylaminopyrimidine deaminase/5-amino-6-(5-phosphoribosylamino)uracil reductase|uniref:bifunctional diaminohydroxyphosphoribosylaminopyrimidine deaminase/5-amino-6-(5-phosphoribosylamino)uracil reductase RibD n=1 Tax=Proteiniphilum sp. TaxID=1926877 RepID=UPI002B21FAB9|nr:bifunctional diaminohydroxyphosphoribosylaminopyrimidine deaminase/5-amino-6-(5-phosphoribosylamino)uracil reductase RibD [Proteiniphilum sp.]MEA5127828.1 bifunctional diaminohydroxyphosphoribosylaminopyrimidine deaminase/5-amino-6-(5-phosphoribosylamino)uracil reductase RibD [Proteiniphilum sp.]
MEINPQFMERCLQLARKGEGFTKPNPLVGAVVVHNGKIIGEGFHRKYGEGHAEVNAIASVKDSALLADSTLYVSLEPCAHYGKTPPCAELIITKGIPRVVVATGDPNPKVSGKGIAMMRENGIEVTVGLLEKEARDLNRIFFVNQLYHRPYILLKWAQSSDGFMDYLRIPGDGKSPVIISNTMTHAIVHKFRTKVQGIMVGTNTALLDNPRLTARKWFGDDPVRVVIDRENKIPADAFLFDGTVPTIVFTASAPSHTMKKENVKYIVIDFSGDTNRQILAGLYDEKIYSLLIEGGARLLTSFIEKEMWDEAYLEIAEKSLQSGVRAPLIQGDIVACRNYPGSVQFHLKSKITRNFH